MQLTRNQLTKIIKEELEAAREKERARQDDGNQLVLNDVREGDDDPGKSLPPDVAADAARVIDELMTGYRDLWTLVGTSKEWRRKLSAQRQALVDMRDSLGGMAESRSRRRNKR